jgi:spore coat protein U-like protein
VRITTAAAPITLSRQGGGATMTMGRVRINGNRNKRLNAAGARTFYVSGRLQVGADQTAGVYDGTFDVTVDYR